MKTSNVIETSSSTILLDEFGIVHIIKKFYSTEDLNDAKENIDAILELTEQKSHPAYIDLTNMKGQNEDAIKYYAEMAKTANCFACAFLIGNMQSTAIGISNIRHGDPKINTALFTVKELAIEWLKKYIQ
ncbi:MAG: hypothetical protein COC01_04345 [Bacteroidetes bacterium]|nr:MAG: hypothetical protein COC01_04345 [Bacteroidota bacterium]